MSLLGSLPILVSPGFNQKSPLTVSQPSSAFRDVQALLPPALDLVTIARRRLPTPRTPLRTSNATRLAVANTTGCMIELRGDSSHST